MLNAMVDHGSRTVSPTAVAVWLVLFRFVDARTGTAKVAHAAIAERLGLHRATVTRTIRELEAAGLARTVRQGGWQRGPSTYRIRGHTPPSGK